MLDNGVLVYMEFVRMKLMCIHNKSGAIYMLFRGSVEYFMNNRNHKGNIYTCNNEAKSGGADDGPAAIY